MLKPHIRTHRLLASTVRMVAVGLAAVLLTTSCGTSAKASTATTTTVASPSGATTSASDLEAVLAHAGIATVALSTNPKPLVAIAGKPVMSFTSDQVAVMASGATTHTGILGAVLDQAHPTAAGYPPFSYVLGAWVATGTSTGALYARSLMGTPDWSEAPQLVFPSVVLPLFTADVVAELHAQPGVGETTTTASALRGERTQYVLAGLVDSPCSLVTSFIDDVMSTVFSALTLTAPAGSGLGATIGSFFVDLFNTAIGYAQKAVHNLLKIIGEAALKNIELMAAGAAVLAEVVTNITPWTASVTAEPASVDLGSGGAFKAKVASALGVDSYPSAIEDCANKLGFTLPSLRAGGVAAKWSLSAPLEPSGALDIHLDDNASSTIGYGTNAPSGSPGGGCSGSGTGSTNGSATGTITISRPGISDLETVVSNVLSTSIPVVGSVVKGLLQPLIDEILGSLDTLTKVTGSATVTLVNPTGGGSGGGGGCHPTPTTTPPTTVPAACMVGSWFAADITIIEGGGSFSGGSGALWAITADGHETVEWDHSGYFDIGNMANFEYTGNEASTVTITSGSSGPWHAVVTSDVRTAVYSKQVAAVTGKPSEAVPSTVGVVSGGTFTCSGDSMTVDASAAGARVIVDLKRA